MISEDDLSSWWWNEHGSDRENKTFVAPCDSSRVERIFMNNRLIFVQVPISVYCQLRSGRHDWFERLLYNLMRNLLLRIAVGVFFLVFLTLETPTREAACSHLKSRAFLSALRSARDLQRLRGYCNQCVFPCVFMRHVQWLREPETPDSCTSQPTTLCASKCKDMDVNRSLFL